MFLINRNLEKPVEVLIEPADIEIEKVESAEILTGKDPEAANSFENKQVVIPEDFDEIKVSKGKALCKVPPLSFVAISFKTV